MHFSPFLYFCGLGYAWMNGRASNDIQRFICVGGDEIS